jgi:hypothetical protein
LSLILREKHRLRLTENKILGKIFGSERDDIIRWQKLHNEGLCNLNSSTDILRLISQREGMQLVFVSMAPFLSMTNHLP